MLSQRVQVFQLSYPAVSVFADPMLLFTFMVTHSVTIYLCKIVELVGENGEFDDILVKYQERALIAAREIARLSSNQGHIGYFKVNHIPIIFAHGPW